MSKRQCSEPGCTREIAARGVCISHYHHVRKAATDVRPRMQDLYPDPVDRFWAQVDKSAECWTWSGYRTPKGYGSVTWGARQRPAHRVSWMIHYGEIPTGQVVRHRCDNPPCVRPDHLQVGTVKENSADMWERGNPVVPEVRGEASPSAKLTELDVAEIRSLRRAGEPAEAVAARFGVSKWTVYKIASGTRWSHSQ